MGQQQYKAQEGKQTEGEGSPHNHHDLKDRVEAKFQANGPMVSNPATGAGAKGNPGKPT